jgi:3-phosphoshikimate 1-carboxyvinyltransferase
MEISGAHSINGEIKIPGDKSISHRSAIISSITHETVAIKNFLFSEDCENTVAVLGKLGVKTERLDDTLIVYGCGIENFREPDDILYVGNSGTTIRLLAGMLASTGFNCVLAGDSSINRRPMGRILKPLSEMGANIYGRDNNTKAPIIIIGNNKLKGRSFDIDVSSAQVKSCLALAGLFSEGTTEIKQPAVSRDHTERMLEYFGADIFYDGKYTRITPGKKLTGKNIFIPCDISSAAYFIVACLILKESRIVIKDIGINPTRSYFIELVKNMGADIKIKNTRVLNNEQIADIEVNSSRLKSVLINKEFIPNIIDEIPVLCVAAAFSEGKTLISGAKELRFKESDRISCIVAQFKKAGVSIEEWDDGITINGNPDLKINEGVYESYGDHRIAMSVAILGLRSKTRISILGSESIDTSFPGFKYELKKAVN